MQAGASNLAPAFFHGTIDRDWHRSPVVFSPISTTCEPAGFRLQRYWRCRRCCLLPCCGRWKFLIDDVFVGKAFDQLPFLISIYVAIAFAKLICSYLSTSLDAALTTQVAQAVRTDLYRPLDRLSPGSVRNNTGDL